MVPPLTTESRMKPQDQTAEDVSWFHEFQLGRRGNLKMPARDVPLVRRVLVAEFLVKFGRRKGATNTQVEQQVKELAINVAATSADEEKKLLQYAKEGAALTGDLDAVKLDQRAALGCAFAKIKARRSQEKPKPKDYIVEEDIKKETNVLPRQQRKDATLFHLVNEVPWLRKWKVPHTFAMHSAFIIRSIHRNHTDLSAQLAVE